MSDLKVKSKAATEEQVSTWINLRQAGRVIQTRLEERLQKEANLSWAEFELLLRLRISAAHPLQMSEIAAQLVGSPSGTTRIADRLVREGLIARETPPENRRIVRVQLTDRGRKVLADADEIIRTTLQEVLGDHFTESEVAELRGLLRKLLESNGAWQDARCAPL